MCKNYNPQLIQRMYFIGEKDNLDALRFGQAFSMDRMDSPDLRGNAMANCLMEFYEADRQFRMESFEVDIKGRTYYVLHSALKVSKETVVEVLNAMAHGAHELPEPSGFPYCENGFAVDSWIDVEHQVFWSVHNFRASFRRLLLNSYAKMEKHSLSRRRAERKLYPFMN